VVTTIRVGAALPPGRDAGYDVLVGRGILADLPRLLAERCAAHLYAVVTDSRVAELHARRVVELLEQAGLAARLFVFPAGEWNKVRSTWSELCDQLLAAQLGREWCLV
jgi:3-dehydroquinate synthase